MGREGGSQGRRKERSQWVCLAFLGSPATLTGQHSLLGPVALWQFSIQDFFVFLYFLWNSTVLFSSLLVVGDLHYFI